MKVVEIVLINLFSLQILLNSIKADANRASLDPSGKRIRFKKKKRKEGKKRRSVD